MGFIEESRQLLQDFVTPEIRSLEARIVAVEERLKSLDSKTDKLGDKIEDLQKNLESRVEKAETRLEAKLERNHAEMMLTLSRMEFYQSLADRVAKIEAKLQNVA
jgi:chromosome segregation ATPase